MLLNLVTTECRGHTGGLTETRSERRQEDKQPPRPIRWPPGSSNQTDHKLSAPRATSTQSAGGTLGRGTPARLAGQVGGAHGAYFRSFSNASMKSSLVISVQNMLLLMSVFILCLRASSRIFALTWKGGRQGVDQTDESLKFLLWFSTVTKFLKTHVCNPVA